MTEASIVTYFLLNPRTQLVKIGRTTNLVKRIASLRTAAGVPLQLLAQLDGDHESRLHETFKAHRTVGVWFTLTPALADSLRNQFGIAIRAPKERAPKPPQPGLHDFRHDLETRAGLGLREPDELAFTEYLYGEAWDRLEAEAAEAAEEGVDPECASEDEHERHLEDVDQALGSTLHLVEDWQEAWIGWMAPPAPPPGWLIFWSPTGAQSAAALRWAILIAAVASDDEATEGWLRLRPVLVHRDTGALEEIAPEVLYSDVALALFVQTQRGHGPLLDALATEPAR